MWSHQRHDGSSVGQLGTIRGVIFSGGIKRDLTKHYIFIWRPLLASGDNGAALFALGAPNGASCVRALCCVVIKAETLLMNYE